MSFYRTPIIEKQPTCIVCDVVVTDGSYICSATCSDIADIAAHGPDYDVDREEEIYA